MNIKSDKPTSLTIEEKDSITVILFDKGNLEAVYESELEADNAALQKQVERLREFDEWLDTKYEWKHRIDFYQIRKKWKALQGADNAE